MSNRSVSRRQFLKAAGVTLTLPLLESRAPLARAAGRAELPRRRMVAICHPLGFLSSNFFPAEIGRDYTLPPYLRVLEELRNDFTIFSGLSHARIARSHTTEITFLTGAACDQPIFSGGFRNTISLDQVAATQIGSETRISSLTIGPSLSFTPTGVKLPGHNKPSEVYARLFLTGNPAQNQSQVRKLRDGQSILDVVRDQAQDLQRDLPARDKARVDEYFTSVRDLEQRMMKAREWENKPRPEVSAPPPADVPLLTEPFAHLKLMFDLVRLALETDSTRLIVLHAGLLGTMPRVGETAQDFHNLSHHGMDPEKIKSLTQLEMELMTVFHQFLAGIKETKEDGESLLARTMVFLGSNLGNASSHETTNLPILLAGGGFKHGQHLAFNKENNMPLCNLYVSMLQRLGLEVSSFGTSKGTLRGLE